MREISVKKSLEINPGMCISERYGDIFVTLRKGIKVNGFDNNEDYFIFFHTVQGKLSECQLRRSLDGEMRILPDASKRSDVSWGCNKCGLSTSCELSGLYNRIKGYYTF